MPRSNIIAIDPGYREIGYARFEGDNLIDFGVKSLRRHHSQASSLIILGQTIRRFIDEQAPDTIVLEKNSFEHVNQNQPVMKVIKSIKRIASSYAISVMEFAPNTIRKTICNSGLATKRQVAQTVCTLYPELVPYLESRQIWRERYYQNMYDAVACGLTYLKLYEKETVKKE